MQRRAFIKKSCVACVGIAGLATLLESCGSSLPMFKTVATDHSIAVPIEKFTSNETMLVIRSASLENDILLLRKDNGYKALNLKCTHEGIALTATSKQIVCPAHGSTFDFNGAVKKEPALRPLKEFTTETKNNEIIIHLT